MTMAALRTRDDKLKWLLRPFDWAFDIAFFGCFFGAVYCYFGLASPTVLQWTLIGALGVIGPLLLWGTARLSNAARGRFAQNGEPD
jgi:hypothetical protein